MNAPSIYWPLRITVFALFGCILWRGAPEAAQAFRYHSAELATLYIALAIILAGTALVADVFIRTAGVGVSRRLVPIFVALCACALAIGISPGGFFPSPFMAAAAALALALFGAAVTGPLRTLASRASIVLFCAAAGAVWEAAALPIVATLLVRN